MKRFLLDSGAATDFVHRRQKVKDRVKAAGQAGHAVGICTPVLGELLGGIEWSKSRDKNLQKLRAVMPLLTLWPYDKNAAEEYGRIYAQLRRIGRLIQQIDMQIAAIAITLGSCTVVSSDQDFKSVPGLSVEDWTI